MYEITVEQKIKGGQLIGPLPDNVATIVNASTSYHRMRVLGYRIQVYNVSDSYNLRIEGDMGTAISGPVYISVNGIAYIQDHLNVYLQPGENIRIKTRITGTIVWSLILENEEEINELD